MKINLNIERLVLDGINIPPAHRHLLQTSVETELAKLITDRSLTPNFSNDTSLPRLSTSNIQLTENNPTQIGRQIAQSVQEGICHE